MKVLVACEFSGIVREAFRKRGHDAWSCDLLDTEIPGNHIKGGVLKILDGGWDLMIAHPPCTHLAVSGARWFKGKQKEQEGALTFIRLLMDAPIPRIALENPIGVISTRIRKPDQIIQPWQFGEGAAKATCLWLKGLPLMVATNILKPQRYACGCGFRFELDLGKYGCSNCCGEKGAARQIYSNQTPSGQNNEPPGDNQAKNRSRTYRGIADAMAEQWG